MRTLLLLLLASPVMAYMGENLNASSPVILNGDTFSVDKSSVTCLGPQINLNTAEVTGTLPGVPTNFVVASDSFTFRTSTISAPSLIFAVNANTSYYFDMSILFRSSATGTGIGLSVTVPAAVKAISYAADIPIAADGTAGVHHGQGTVSDDVILGTGVEVANTTYMAKLQGMLLNGANSGNIQLRFRSEVQGSTVTIKAGSFGLLYAL